MVKALKAGDTRGACSQLDAFMREFEEKNKTCMAIENFMMEFLEEEKAAAILCVPVCGMLFTRHFLTGSLRRGCFSWWKG